MQTSNANQIINFEVHVKKLKKMFEQSFSSRFFESCLSLTAFTVLGFTAVEPVSAASIHTGFASYTITDLGVGNTYSINNFGQVVMGKNGAGWIWENGILTEVTGSTWAYQINASGLVFGITHAALWENGTVVDLGTLPGHNDSNAYDINDLGVAIGYSANTNTQQSKPVLWSNGQPTELKTLGGNVNYGIAINNKGQAVGYGNTGVNGSVSHGIIWEDGEIANINSLISADSGWFVQQINGINDRGQIVGQGINNKTGANHALLLDPISGSSQRNPVLPDKFEDGWHIFNNALNRLWFDPPTSAGFAFKIGGDAVASSGDCKGDGCIFESSPNAVNPALTQPSLFTKILSLPSGIDADELFSVIVGGQEIGKFRPNEVVDFVALLGYGVSEFSVTDIDALIDPTNPLAFPIKLESNRDKFSFKMRAIDGAEAVPEPSEIGGIVTATAVFGSLLLKRKRSDRKVQVK